MSSINDKFAQVDFDERFEIWPPEGWRMSDQSTGDQVKIRIEWREIGRDFPIAIWFNGKEILRTKNRFYAQQIRMALMNSSYGFFDETPPVDDLT